MKRKVLVMFTASLLSLGCIACGRPDDNVTTNYNTNSSYTYTNTYNNDTSYNTDYNTDYNYDDYSNNTYDSYDNSNSSWNDSDTSFEQEILKGAYGYHTWNETDNQRYSIGDPSDMYGIPIYKYDGDEQRIQFSMDYSESNLSTIMSKIEDWCGSPREVNYDDNYTDYYWYYDTYYIHVTVTPEAYDYSSQWDFSEHHIEPNIRVLVDNDKYVDY